MTCSLFLAYREHFEEAMKFAHYSMSNQDIRHYKILSQVCHGLFWFYLYSCLHLTWSLQQSSGFGNDFKFSEGEGGHEAATMMGNAGLSNDTANDEQYA